MGRSRWGKTAMRPLIGIVDNPYQASQKPLMVDFPNGHAVVFGASGTRQNHFPAHDHHQPGADAFAG